MSKINIRRASMIYDDGDINEVEVNYRFKGDRLESGRGDVKMSYDKYEDNKEETDLELYVLKELKKEIENEIKSIESEQEENSNED